MDLGHKYNVMLKVLGEAIDHFPAFASAYRQRGTLYQAKGDDKAALPEFTKAIRLNPEDAEAFYERGMVRWNHGRGNHAAALRDFDEAIRLRPGNWLYLHYRGEVRRSNNDFKGALADFDEAISISPDHASSYYQRALVLKRLGRRAAAVADLKIYVDRDRIKGYRDHREERRADELLKELKKRK
jgi:Flp pilus assembly protein TadD